jgi:hypothetical protein
MPVDKKALRSVLNVPEATGRQIMFRNFAGAATKLAPKGTRKFNLALDTDIANELTAEGWNIKWLEPRDPADGPQAHVEVAVKFEHFPPKIILISGKGKTVLKEESVQILDYAEIESADLIIQPYAWEMNGKHGIKAYLKAMYVTLKEDEFAAKYYDVPDTALPYEDSDR